ncbi:uncharacterized protein LOC126373728 [Pectinophora gossypiella]|uniref:uncharacterized protein LOC126373728 n=1 Tax=Pectinophora gossypiella TaxID=13191 RepID=UPI00214F2BFF|nr:uncharacterized protein LOC126373728 [Pectinophora gossypiella]
MSFKFNYGHLGCDGVKRVIVTAPSIDVPMVILGVNDTKIKPEYKVISCGSSTLYCLAPIVKVLEDNYGVEEGFITSIHAMTPSLKPLDGLCLRGKHWRDHRSITQNIIPAVTGACKALGRIIPAVRDKMCGLAFRVPIVNVSVLDLTVSMQLKPNSYKLICWYENEYSYACRVVDLIIFSEAQFNQQNKNKTTYVRPKTSKKQDGIQQTESVKDAPRKDTAEVKTKDVPDIKSRMEKPLPRPVLMKKPVITQNPLPLFQHDADRRIYNKASPTIAACDCSKAQERLEKVKKEFSKMVGITEHLLRKSNNSKLSLATLQQEADDVLDRARIYEIKTDKKESNQLEKIHKNKPLDASMCDAKGDGETNT